jgi:eukaryotic-like serine/threonine-protein kinase
MEQHLDPDTLAAYVDGRLELEELGSADRHIDACGSCRSELSALAAVHTLPVGPEREVPEGMLGRYHVLRELGRGSMGVVLRAYDPELARPVAIKLLRDVTRDELRDEARTLARLRHPNVVTIYDVFTDEHGVYLAMELVDGDTLRGFAKGRSREQILDACVRAGRGLAAAHDAGVIHRDFKPENVLCSDDGEVRVSDFGLARAADAAADGAIAGTPAYMAPEVVRREPATARSDQYSYCMTVNELLSGRRSADVDASLPPWIARALRRGLAKDPSDRFASMHELLAALVDDPRVRRRRRLALAGVAAGALATGAIVVALARSSGPSCAIDERALAGAWTPARSLDLTRALAGDAPSVIAALDHYAKSWLAARHDACAATHDRGEQSQLALDRRVACLDRRRRELGELVGLLGSADAKLAASAQDAVARLRDPGSCTGTDEADALPTDAVGRVIVEQARTLLDRAAALQFAAKLEQADALAAHVIASVQEPRLVAEALLVRARVSIDRSQYDRAEDQLFEALHAAERGRDDRTVAAIWVEIVMTTGAQKHRFDLALSNARAADAALARIEPGELQLRYDYTLGAMLLAQGKLDDARKRLEHGLSLATHDDDPRRKGQLGLYHATLCDAERQAGKLPVAREHCKQAQTLLDQAFGPDHMRLALLHNISGALAFAEHDLATAERSYMRVIEILDRRNQSDQITYALALSNLGAVYSSRDDIAQARTYFERALAKFDAQFPEHPQRVLPLQGLASIALRTGDTTLAVRYYEGVREAMAATYAPENPSLLIADYNLALAYFNHKQPAKAQAVLDSLIARAQTEGKQQWVLAARGLDLTAQLADQRRDYQASLALAQRARAAIDHVDNPVERAMVLRHLGEIHRHLKRPALAIDLLERAIVDFGTDVDPYEIGSARYHLAFALWDSGRDKPRAIEIAKQAAADLGKAQTGEALQQYRDMLAKFLALHK